MARARGCRTAPERQATLRLGDRIRHDAEERLRELVAEAGRGNVGRSVETLDDLFDRWLEGDARRNVRPNTLAQCTQTLRLYVRPKLGKMRAQAFQRWHAKDLFGELADSGLSESTIKLARAALVGALNAAVEDGILASNPAIGLKIPRNTPTPRAGKSLTVDQARAFLAAAKGDRLEAFFVTMLGLGLRPIELRGLEWNDFDAGMNVVAVSRSLLRVDGGWKPFPTKSKKGTRRFQVPAFVARALRDHRDRQEADRLAAGASWTDHGLVFTDEAGKPVDASNVRARHFIPIRDRAGLPSDFPLKDLRHANATLLHEAGIEDATISARLGHSTTEFSKRVYTHPTKDADRRAGETLERLLGEPAPLNFPDASHILAH